MGVLAGDGDGQVDVEGGGLMNVLLKEQTLGKIRHANNIRALHHVAPNKLRRIFTQKAVFDQMNNEKSQKLFSHTSAGPAFADTEAVEAESFCTMERN